MAKNGKISDAVIRRLPKYYRYLGDLLKNGINRISSNELSRLTGFTASQIRQDLNNFGGFGQQGYGYDAKKLREEISKILGLDHKYKVVIVGAGNIGQAVANYAGFYEEGFEIMALFDKNPKLVGLRIRDLEIMDIDDLKEYLTHHKIDLVVLCTPKEASQGIADIVTSCGVQAIWNFAPTDIKVTDNVAIENVRMNESLYTLVYYYNEKSNNFNN
ncbi:MAG: redox-sensing transcriptional repressor Rex [Tissierellales bacterium]|nr:redox-sensing transcriptional repressor Rex [Tissierellales bacterium]MBN2827048.1 redox-sensing transcriptional repressor Rex [Tissierellales bacterium]